MRSAVKTLHEASPHFSPRERLHLTPPHECPSQELGHPRLGGSASRLHAKADLGGEDHRDGLHRHVLSQRQLGPHLTYRPAQDRSWTVPGPAVALASNHGRIISREFTRE